jgi:hypothetical protein
MSHSHSAGILEVLDFMSQNIDELFQIELSFDKYENPVKIQSDHIKLHVDPNSHIIHHQFHTYHGERCFVTNSPLSSAAIEL